MNDISGTTKRTLSISHCSTESKTELRRHMSNLYTKRKNGKLFQVYKKRNFSGLLSTVARGCSHSVGNCSWDKHLWGLPQASVLEEHLQLNSNWQWWGGGLGVNLCRGIRWLYVTDCPWDLGRSCSQGWQLAIWDGKLTVVFSGPSPSSALTAHGCCTGEDRNARVVISSHVQILRE